MMGDEVLRRQAEIRADLCPAIESLLSRLHSSGKLIGVVTGNFEAIGWAKLSAGGLRKFFDFGSFSDQTERRADIFRNALAEVRRRLGPEATSYVIGDTPSDIAAAQEVGVPIVAVATGIFPFDELQALGPDACLGCCAELLPPSFTGR
jgi:phosphoglycolate phosphatase-like HAD superfamily hydrolase